MTNRRSYPSPFDSSHPDFPRLPRPFLAVAPLPVPAQPDYPLYSAHAALPNRPPMPRLHFPLRACPTTRPSSTRRFPFRLSMPAPLHRSSPLSDYPFPPIPDPFDPTTPPIPLPLVPSRLPNPPRRTARRSSPSPLRPPEPMPTRRAASRLRSLRQVHPSHPTCEPSRSDFPPRSSPPRAHCSPALTDYPCLPLLSARLPIPARSPSFASRSDSPMRNP